MYLRCAVHDTPKHWAKWLSLAELWYNTSYHTALQCTPFKALYGTDPSPGMLPNMTNVTNTDVTDTIKERQLFLESLKEHLSRAQTRMKTYVDAKRSDRHFLVGDFVLLKLQPYAQSSVINRPCPKLAFKYSGPYKMLEKLGTMAYKLDTYIVPPEGRSGGLWLMWNDDIDLTILHSSHHYILAQCVYKPGNQMYNLVCMYGDPHHLKTDSIWQDVSSFVFAYPNSLKFTGK